MIVCANSTPLDEDQQAFRKRALRDAVLCIGWLKLTSIICFILLYFLVRVNSKGEWSEIIQIMLLVVIPLQVLNGMLLFFGALEEKPMVLGAALLLCLLIASYNTIVGVIGSVYFIKTGHYTVHFFLAVTFALLALSLFTVLCHDIVIIYAFKQMLLSCPLENYVDNTVSWDKY